jgi:hypothetical protein
MNDFLSNKQQLGHDSKQQLGSKQGNLQQLGYDSSLFL